MTMESEIQAKAIAVWEMSKPQVKEILMNIFEGMILEGMADLAEKTENKIDDAMVDMLKPILIEAVKAQIEKL